MRCYRCDGEGHMARECPGGGGDTGGYYGGDKSCYECGAPDHLARDCHLTRNRGAVSQCRKYVGNEMITFVKISLLKTLLGYSI